MKPRNLSNFFTSRASALIATLVLCHTATEAGATTFLWTGNGGTTFMNGSGNWSPTGLPSSIAGDIGQFDGNKAGDLVLGTNGPSAGANPWSIAVTSGQVSSLTLDTPSNANGIRVYNITIDSGAFSNSGAAFSLGNGAGTPILNLGSATAPYTSSTFTNNSAATALVQSDIRLASGGSIARTLTFDGTGNWNVTAPLGITSGTGSLAAVKNGSGALTLGGANTFTDGFVLNQGTLNLNSVTALGVAASTFTIAGGTLDNTSGAAKILTPNNPLVLNADFAYGTSAGTSLNDLSLGSGVVNLGTAAGTSRTINTDGGGLLTISGVISNGTTANSLIKTGIGGLKLDSPGTYTGGTTLSAGTLQLASSLALGSGTVTVNGGTFVPRIAARTIPNPVLVGGDFSIGVAAVGNQMNFSGTINLGGATRTITVPDTTQATDSIISGVISNGAFTKSGGGTLVLSAANTFSGPTVVSQGVLVLNNSTPLDSSSSVAINGSGAKLVLSNNGLSSPATLLPATTLSQGTVDGNGTINSLTVTNSVDNIVSAGNGNMDTLTVGSLNFQGAASLNLTNSGPYSVQKLSVTDLTTNAAAHVVVNATSSTGVWSDNTDYELIDFTNYTSSANASHFTLTPLVGLNPSQHATLVNVGYAIVLRITTDALFWTGNANSNWTTTTLTPKNWTDNGTPVVFTNTRAVTFDDTASVYDVNVAANVSPSSVVFNNDFYPYTVSSTGGFGILTGSLTKNGSAPTTISTSNSYTGPTIINGGTLEFDTTIASSSSVAINNNAALVLNLTGSSNVYANPITGNGGVTKNGSGNLTLSGANTFTGSFTLNAGALNFNSPSALGTGTGVVTINGGSIDNTSGVPIVATASKPQAWNADITFTGTNNLDMGSGTVTLGGTGDRTVSVSTGDVLTVGEIKGSSQGLSVSGGGTLILTSSGSYADASNIAGTLTIGSGTTLQMNRATAATDAASTGDFVTTGLSGTGTITNGALVNPRSIQVNTVGNFTFGGTIANGGAGTLALNKQGAGTLTLTGSSSYTGNTVVGGGILNVQNGNALGASQVSMASRAAGIQLQGNISIPSSVTFTLSNDGTPGAVVPFALDNVSGNNTINGPILVTTGAGGASIQSDSGTLTLAGNISVAPGQSSRGIILQGDSTAANTVSGIVSDLSATSVCSITKNGAGTWTLTGTNTYTGATTINGGTLQLGNGTTDGTIGTSNSVVNNGALVYNWTTSHTAGYVISGTGSVTKNGAGTATLTGVNTYTGTTTVNAGELGVTGNSIADAGTIVINGGKVNLTGTETVASLFFGGVQQPAGSYTASDATHFSGSGTLVVTSGPVVTSGFSNWASSNGATGQSASDDHDKDGVPNGIEFFVGATGSGFTALPPVVTTAGVRTVTWPKSASYTGTYEVQVSSDLTTWTAAPGGSVTDNGTTVVFTFPAGPTVRFVRLTVKPS